MKKNIFFIVISLSLVFCNQDKNVDSNVSHKELDPLFADMFDVNSKNRFKNEKIVLKTLSKIQNDSLKIKILLKLAGYYDYYGNQKKFFKISLESLNNSIEIKDSTLICKSLKNLGNYYYDNFQNDSAYYYYTKAEKIHLKIKSNLDFNYISLFKSNILCFEKDFAGCETSVIEVLKVALIKKDNRLIYDCYITLGNALDGLNNFEKSLEYYNKAFEITNKLRTDNQYNALKAQNYSFIGNLYKKNKKYQTAISFYEKALKFDDFKKSDKYIYANLINNLAYSEFKLGNKSAIDKLNEAYKIRDSLKNIPGIVSSKINLSEYYLFQKDTLKALGLANQAKVTAHENKIFEDELKTLELLAKIDPKNNETYNNRFIKLTDSLQNNERATRNKFARIEFETDEILNEKKTIEVEKNQISSQRWIILSLSLLAMIIGGLLYFTKIQHAKNKQLQLEKEQQVANEAIYQLMLDQQSKIDEGRNAEKKRISQELHDGIMSKLTSTRLNLFVLSKKTDEETIKKCLVHIANIQDIEKEIRAISHDLSKDIFTTKDSFKIILDNLFKDQSQVSNWKYEFFIDPNINWENIESTTKMHLYRIFQESLQNINKYANAKNVNANISRKENQIVANINDNGVGFDVSKSKNGIGLENMSSRCKSINAELKIDTKIGSGTNISILFPI